MGLLTGLIALVFTVGCTKADSPTVAVSTNGNPTLSDSASTAGPASSPVTTSATTAATTSTPTSTPPSTTPSTVAPSKPVAAGCAGSALSVSVDRGSGVAGHQYATVIFKNTSATACPLGGFPGVQLLSGGASLGRSVRSGVTATTVQLAPGGSAVSQLVNDSTCGAAVSDSVQIIAPNTTTKVVLPLSFRGCTVTIDPVKPA